MTALTATTPDKKRSAALVLGAIGVVYGDIGTSPLYMLRTAFTGERRYDRLASTASLGRVLGAVSS